MWSCIAFCGDSLRVWIWGILLQCKFDVKWILLQCSTNERRWRKIAFVFVLRLNPLHVSSCEVVAWLAHLWWRLSCLSQRFSYVTSDAWSRNVIRLCGITVCVRELCPFCSPCETKYLFSLSFKAHLPPPIPFLYANACIRLFGCFHTRCHAALVVIVCSTFSLCDSDESSESDD